MRFLLALAAMALTTACTDVTPNAGRGAVAEGEGYTLEIRANGEEQVYLVTAPGGETVGGRAADGASALLDADGVRALAAPADVDAPEVLSVRVPGFEMSIGAESDEQAGDGDGNVTISIGGGAQRIQVDADEGGPGDADDRAHVVITGADAQAVREFLAKADHLSPDVQAQMLAELGIE